jgi:predicted thioredoxin/glutaredoxin
MKALNRKTELSNSANSYITHLIHAEATDIEVDPQKFQEAKIRVMSVPSYKKDGKVYYIEELLSKQLKKLTTSKYTR